MDSTSTSLGQPASSGAPAKPAASEGHKCAPAADTARAESRPSRLPFWRHGHRPRLMLVSDLVQNEDPTHRRLLTLNALWHLHNADARDLLLVYSTGRSPRLYRQLWEDAPLLTPAVLICSVGTEIFYLVPEPEDGGPDGPASGGDEGRGGGGGGGGRHRKYRFEPDPEWEALLDVGWDRALVAQVAARFPELRQQVASEQRRHKLSFHLDCGQEAQPGPAAAALAPAAAAAAAPPPPPPPATAAVLDTAAATRTGNIPAAAAPPATPREAAPTEPPPSPAATSPAATSPAATSPAATSPAATSPAATSPAATSPAATSPAATSPAATSPVATSPAATSPAATSPAATSPAATSPAATSPAATSPAATSPAATSPAATSPAATSPAATSPAATSPAATSPAATSPAATSPAATSPAATSPAATSPAATAASPPRSSRGPEEVLRKLQEALREEGLRVKVVYSGGRDVDLLAEGAGKGAALRFLLDRMRRAGLEPGFGSTAAPPAAAAATGDGTGRGSDGAGGGRCGGGGRGSAGGGGGGVLVAGDSGNDIELFQVPGVRGCVVANAFPELRQWAQRQRQQRQQQRHHHHHQQQQGQEGQQLPPSPEAPVADRIFLASEPCAGGILQALYHFRLLSPPPAPPSPDVKDGDGDGDGVPSRLRLLVAAHTRLVDWARGGAGGGAAADSAPAASDPAITTVTSAAVPSVHSGTSTANAVRVDGDGDAGSVGGGGGGSGGFTAGEAKRAAAMAARAAAAAAAAAGGGVWMDEVDLTAVAAAQPVTEVASVGSTGGRRGPSAAGWRVSCKAYRLLPNGRRDTDRMAQLTITTPPLPNSTGGGGSSCAAAAVDAAAAVASGTSALEGTGNGNVPEHAAAAPAAAPAAAAAESARGGDRLSDAKDPDSMALKVSFRAVGIELSDVALPPNDI